jgi:hypothetical protein
MNKWIEVILGIILIIAPLYVALAWGSWGQATIEFIMGGIVVGVILIGLLLLILGISDIKG